MVLFEIFMAYLNRLKDDNSIVAVRTSYERYVSVNQCDREENFNEPLLRKKSSEIVISCDPNNMKYL